MLAARITFPPLDDPAFYVQTARNLAAGRGLVSDVLWSYQFSFPSVSHPSHEYWMPMATLLMAPWIRALGDTLFAAQLPGTLCGALLVPLTYALGRIVLPGDRRIAVGAALLLLAGALPVYQAASTDSAAPFAVLGAGALLVGGMAIERRSVSLSLLAGLLGGLAYLTRSDGMLIPALTGAIVVGSLGLTRQGLWMLVALAAGCAVPMGAWWIRNGLTFGVLQPVSPVQGVNAAQKCSEDEAEAEDQRERVRPVKRKVKSEEGFARDLDAGDRRIEQHDQSGSGAADECERAEGDVLRHGGEQRGGDDEEAGIDGRGEIEEAVNCHRLPPLSRNSLPVGA